MWESYTSEKLMKIIGDENALAFFCRIKTKNQSSMIIDGASKHEKTSNKLCLRSSDQRHIEMCISFSVHGGCPFEILTNL